MRHKNDMQVLPEGTMIDISQLEPLADNMGQCPEDIQRMDDYDNRILWLDHDICQEDDALIMRSIIRWNQEDAELPVDKRKPIQIYINSNGGEISAAFALYDVILLSKTPVYGINVGYAFSAAFIVLLACHRRYGTPHSWYMMHRGSGDMCNTDHMAAHNSMRHWDLQVESMIDAIYANTNITREEAEKFMMSDSYFSSTDAFDLGFIHDIVITLDDIGKGGMSE